MLLIFKSFGLWHKHIFIEIAIKKGIIDVNLLHFLAVAYGYAHNRANGLGFDYGTERFREICPRGLMKIICNKSSLKPGDATIRVVFHLKA